MSTTPLKFNQTILIHGVGLTRNAWDDVKRELNLPNIVAVDLPGHGTSSEPPMTHIEDASRYISQSITSPTLLIGHSLGSLITLNMLVNAYPNIAGAVLINPVYQRDSNAKSAVLKRYDDLINGHNDPTATLNRWYGGEFADARAKTKEWLENNGSGYEAAYRVFAHYEDEPLCQLKDISQPVLIISSEHDPNSTPAMADELAAIMPKAEHKMLPATAHMAIMTHPQLVGNSIQTWINEVGYDD